MKHVVIQPGTSDPAQICIGSFNHIDVVTPPVVATGHPTIAENADTTVLSGLAEGVL
ncbi:MAG: hypothetical protein GY935_27080 [Gammaproteobacteria bacterium]|nr:hypothetical protein [Gammaproteobacteria bacterium]